MDRNNVLIAPFLFLFVPNMVDTRGTFNYGASKDWNQEESITATDLDRGYFTGRKDEVKSEEKRALPLSI